MALWHSALVGLFIALLSLEVSAKERVYETEARFVMGDGDTKQEAQQQAFVMAKMKALEEAGVYIKAQTTMLTSESEGHIEEDFKREIKAIAAGVTKIRAEDVVYVSEFDPTTSNVTWVCRIKAVIDEDSVREQIETIGPVRLAN